MCTPVRFGGRDIASKSRAANRLRLPRIVRESVEHPSDSELHPAESPPARAILRLAENPGQSMRNRALEAPPLESQWTLPGLLWLRRAGPRPCCRGQQDFASPDGKPFRLRR